MNASPAISPADLASFWNDEAIIPNKPLSMQDAIASYWQEQAPLGKSKPRNGQSEPRKMREKILSRQGGIFEIPSCRIIFWLCNAGFSLEQCLAIAQKLEMDCKASSIIKWHRMRRLGDAKADLIPELDDSQISQLEAAIGSI